MKLQGQTFWGRELKKIHRGCPRNIREMLKEEKGSQLAGRERGKSWQEMGSLSNRWKSGEENQIQL